MAVGTVKSQHVDTPYVTAANRTCGECRMLCWALAVVYIWFGALKPFGLSPADALVHKTVPFIPESLFLPFLGFWEVAIGVCFLFRRLLPSALALMGLQITGVGPSAFPQFCNDFVQGSMQAPDLHVGQATCFTSRVEPPTPQDLIGKQVAQAGQSPLIHQTGFQGGSARTQQLLQRC